MIRKYAVLIVIAISGTLCCSSHAGNNLKYNNLNHQEMNLTSGLKNYIAIKFIENNKSIKLLGVFRLDKSFKSRKNEIGKNYLIVENESGRKKKFGWERYYSTGRTPSSKIESFIEYDEEINKVSIFENEKCIGVIEDDNKNLKKLPIINIIEKNNAFLRYSINGDIDFLTIYGLSKDFTHKRIYDLLRSDEKSNPFSGTLKLENNIIVYFIATKGLKIYISYYSPTDGFVLNYQVIEKVYN